MEEREPFRAGDVWGRSFSIFFTSLPTLLGLMVIVYSPLLLYTAYEFSFWRFDGGHGSEFEPALVAGGALLLQQIATAAVIRAVFQQMQEGTASVRTSLATGLARLPAVLGVVISRLFVAGGPVLLGLVVVGMFSAIFGVLAVLVFPFAFIPGLWAWTVFWVAVPAVVVERQGGVRAFNRSMELTHGVRWRVFSVVAILLVFQIVFEFAMFRLSGPTSLLVERAVLIVFSALEATVITVTYYQLRRAKDGFGLAELAKVFA